jgi:hypothetical protein
LFVDNLPCFILHLDQNVKLKDHNRATIPNFDGQIWKIGEVFNDKYFTIKHYKGSSKDKLKDTGYYLTANAMSNPILKTKDGKKI